MDENVFVRCKPNDPQRCQGVGLHGQCPYKAKDGYKFCSRHNARTDTIEKLQEVKMYQLQQYQERVDQLSGHSDLKNLKNEIGIVRMALEKIIVQCHGDDNTLVAYSGKIADMAVKIRTLISTCHKLDVQLGNVLERDKVLLIGQSIVELVAEIVPDQEKLDALGEKIVERIMKISMGTVDDPRKS